MSLLSSFLLSLILFIGFTFSNIYYSRQSNVALIMFDWRTRESYAKDDPRRY